MLSPAPASSRSSASPKSRAASGWMMSTDCSRSNGIFLDFLNTQPVSIRSSSSSITKRVKYQVKKPATPAITTTAATIGRIQRRSAKSSPSLLPSGTRSRTK